MMVIVAFLSRTPSPEMTPEERDVRTVFCMQLAARIRPKDIEEFFSAVGKVHLTLALTIQPLSVDSCFVDSILQIDITWEWYYFHSILA